MNHTPRLNSRTHPLRRARLSVEQLEPREVPALNPTGMEQEMLELVNRMRMNPAAELALLVDNLNPIHSPDPDVNFALNYFDVDGSVLASQWASLTAVAPLAWHEALVNAARAHSQLMINHDQQSHQLPGEPSLGTRITNAGYPNKTAWAENIFAFADSVFYGHAGFAIDWGFTSTGIQNPPGHRNNIMNGTYREIGIGIIAENNPGTSVGPLVITQDFGNRSSFGNPYLLGVAFDDLNGNGYYNAGEGLGGITVQAVGTPGTFTTTTMNAGGYQMKLPTGTYTVTFSGGALGSPVSMTVTIGSANIKRDLVTGTQSGRIEGVVFDDQNDDGIHNGGEPGLQGRTVYLDANNNGARDAGEVHVKTDANGVYRFIGLPIDTYRVRTEQPAGWILTAPGSGSHIVDLAANAYSTDNDFGSRTPYHWLPKFGVFTDQDGDVFTVQLQKKGRVGVMLDDADQDGRGAIADLLLVNTRPGQSKLIIKVIQAAGNGQVDIGSISGSGIKKINAQNSDLVGSGVTLDGFLGGLVIRDIRNGADILAQGGPKKKTNIIARDIGNGTTINVKSSINKLVVRSFDAGLVQAPRIGMLSVLGDPEGSIAGDFQADITLTGSPVSTLPTLGRASIAGAVLDAFWSIGGRVGVVNVDQFIGSTLFVRYTPDHPADPMDGGSFGPGSKIRKFRAGGGAGTAFVDSTIGARKVGTVSLHSIEEDNGGSPFGVLAAQLIGRVLVGDPAFEYNPAAPDPQGIGDFQVVRV